MYNFIIAVGLSLAAFSSFADHGSTMRSPVRDFDRDSIRNHCNFIPSAHLCRVTPGCYWNDYRQHCERNGGGGGGGAPQRCGYINHRHDCNHTPGCYWEHGYCYSYGGGGGGGGGAPQHCGDIYGHHRCNDTPGCYWDRHQDRCRRNW